MGGKNIIIVMDDANLDLAVDGAVWGGFGTTGQRCTAASRVAVHKRCTRIHEKFVARAKKLKVGDGWIEDRHGAVHQRAAAQDGHEIRPDWQDEGAKLATGGHRFDKGPFAKGWFHEPTVFVDCDPAMRISGGEFWPGGLLMPFERWMRR